MGVKLLFLVEEFCSGKTQCLLWQDKISVVARQDVCCGKTRSLLWPDKISLVARHKGIHKGGRAKRRPLGAPPKAAPVVF